MAHQIRDVAPRQATEKLDVVLDFERLPSQLAEEVTNVRIAVKERPFRAA